MLPGEMNGWYWHRRVLLRGGSRWLNWFESEDGDKMTLRGQPHRWLISGDTEADARAKMLIYLMENKLITLQ